MLITRGDELARDCCRVAQLPFQEAVHLVFGASDVGWGDVRIETESLDSILDYMRRHGLRHVRVAFHHDVTRSFALAGMILRAVHRRKTMDSDLWRCRGAEGRWSQCRTFALRQRVRSRFSLAESGRCKEDGNRKNCCPGDVSCDHVSLLLLNSLKSFVGC